jgi:hypothetical protein
MKKKLTPITGAIIVGLVGYANATCYQQTSYVCLAAGTVFLIEHGSDSCYHLTVYFAI